MWFKLSSIEGLEKSDESLKNETENKTKNVRRTNRKAKRIATNQIRNVKTEKSYTKKLVIGRQAIKIKKT